MIRNQAIDDLTPHPRNADVYRDGPDEALVASVREHGILTPLVVTESFMVISGHRRLAAARAAGMTSVPIMIRHFPTLADELEALVAANAQRAKTNEQTAREGLLLLEAEGERARAREEASLKKGASFPAREIFPERGRARDLAASRLGRSGRWLEQAVAVVREIDALREAGDESGAEKLTEALNIGAARAYEMLRQPAPVPAPAPSRPGVAPSAKPVRRPSRGGGVPASAPEVASAIPDGPQVVCGLGKPVPEALQKAMLAGVEVRSLLGMLRQAERVVSRLCEDGKAPALRRACQIKGDGESRKFVLQSLRSAVTVVKMSEPYTLCPYCYEVCPGRASAKCEHCSATGIVTRDQFERAEASIRAAVEGR